MNEKKTKTPYARKSFGQNFLVDQHYIRKIIDALKPQPGETIIEIGPGRGALTDHLVASGAGVVAIEIERAMIAILRGRFKGQENFKLIEQDALNVDYAELAEGKKVKLVANLPYYISTAILQKLIDQRQTFAEMILMFQREVVERITARTGSKERGYLTVMVEAFLRTEKLFDVPPTAFRPAPKVWSAIARLITKESNQTLSAHQDLFRALVSAGFAQKRKTILNNLKNSPKNLQEKIGDPEKILSLSQIDPGRRGETLSLAEWQRVLEACLKQNSSKAIIC